MSRILFDWISKLKLSLENYLSPHFMVGIRKNPTLIFLGFDNKYPEPGYKNMINLRCVATELESYVIQ